MIILSKKARRILKDIKGIGGRLVDIYRIWASEVCKPHSKTKFEVIKKIKKECEAKTLVETGTYLGVTARRSSNLFENVFTIELSKELANRARKKFRNIDNIEVVQGDAVEKISGVLEKNRCQRALVFLDAHYSGGETTYGDVPEPALKELGNIEQYDGKVRAIIIDDFLDFGTNEGFPEKSELIKRVEDLFPKEKGWEIGIIFNMVVVKKS